MNRPHHKYKSVSQVSLLLHCDPNLPKTLKTSPNKKPVSSNNNNNFQIKWPSAPGEVAGPKVSSLSPPIPNPSSTGNPAGDSPSVTSSSQTSSPSDSQSHSSSSSSLFSVTAFQGPSLLTSNHGPEEEVVEEAHLGSRSRPGNPVSEKYLPTTPFSSRWWI